MEIQRNRILMNNDGKRQKKLQRTPHALTHLFPGSEAREDIGVFDNE